MQGDAPEHLAGPDGEEGAGVAALGGEAHQVEGFLAADGEHDVVLAAFILSLATETVTGQDHWAMRHHAAAGEFGSAVEFGSITAVTLGPRGVYVGDGMNSRVVILDPGLQPLRAVGRRGSGPGEFRSLEELTVRGDTVYIYDPALLRLTAVTETGETVWTQPALTPMSVRSGRPIRGMCCGTVPSS
jgi:hypothetical protein